ncbi:MAG TPA: hypothetical protein VF166_02640 [Gemmatimonadaceae bacterium]
MSPFPCRRAAGRASLALVASVVLASCGGHNHLERYAFTNRALAVVYLAPPSPDLETGIYNLRHVHTPLDAVVRAGSDVAKEVEGRKARARLDTASTRVNPVDRMSQRTLDRASRYLGTRAVQTPDSADYLLEVNLTDYGIDARGQSAAYLYMKAQVVLLDHHDGHEIWDSNVSGWNRLTPFVRAGEHVPTGIITAGVLSTVSVDDFQQVLQELSDYTSDIVTNELRNALWDVRK